MLDPVPVILSALCGICIGLIVGTIFGFRIRPDRKDIEPPEELGI